MKERLLCKPFNGVYLAVFALFAAFFVIGVLVLRKKEEKTRARALAAVMFITLIGFFFYKYFLFLDKDYSRITTEAGIGEFNWWGELPLQLCNVNMILIPIAALTKNRLLLCFSFFMGPLGALLALIMPGTGFECYSILLPRMIGYYGTHWMVVFGSYALVALGLYKPKFRDYFLTLLSAFTVAFVVFLINVMFRVTGLNEFSNYFFTHNPDGNPILELFHSWVPVPFLCLIPCALILTPYVMLVDTIAWFCERKKASAENVTETAAAE
ncbi:MAG: YwaF family protein [Lachnospiraceae bacterium]|nr:YwaF family protein [Lachnospiraceae bacterium]